MMKPDRTSIQRQMQFLKDNSVKPYIQNSTFAAAAAAAASNPQGFKTTAPAPASKRSKNHSHDQGNLQSYLLQ